MAMSEAERHLLLEMAAAVVEMNDVSSDLRALIRFWLERANSGAREGTEQVGDRLECAVCGEVEMWCQCIPSPLTVALAVQDAPEGKQ